MKRVALAWVLLFAAARVLGAPQPAAGADLAGNPDGTVPAWGKDTLQPPLGWTAAAGYPDPFADERPLHVIDAATAGRHKEWLSEGLQALLARNPAFRMPVYPTHRTAARPPCVSAGAQCGDSAVPYPQPRNGLEAITNHLLRPLGGGVDRTYDAFVVRPDGRFLRFGFREQRVYDSHFDQPMPDRLFSFIGRFTDPADLVGTVFLVHEPNPVSATPRKAWIYNAGQRRVRRAPDLAYDSVQDGADGLAVVDQYDGYNGAPDRYDWQLRGKRELLVPYNTYRIGDKRIPYSQVIGKGSPNPDLLRFERHRVWVVEATLKPGQRHVYPRRVFYLDEDSWSVVLSEAWDGRGRLWRVGLHGLVQFYDVQVPWYRFEAWFDLDNGSYVLTGLDNERKSAWQFGGAGRSVDFQPDALRRLGP